MWVGDQRHAPAALFPGTHCIGDWVSPRNSLGRCGIRSPDRLARSKSLYRLSYPGTLIIYSLNIINWNFQICFASIYSILTSDNEVSYQ
jgi:hypothetical protein